MKLFNISFLTSSMAALMMGGLSLAEDIEHMDALHVAAATGNVNAMKRHLEMGADINAKNEDGDTALHIAVKRSGYVEFVVALLKLGADPNATDQGGQTPLFHAALNAMVLRHSYSGMYQNRPKFEEHLLPVDLALDPDHPKPHPKPDDWNAEVRKALGPGQADLNAMVILKALLDAGAKPDLKDKQGFAPLDLAKAHGNYERLAQIMNLDAKHMAGMAGSSSIMHGGATYWVIVHGGHKSAEPLKMLEKKLAEK